MLSITHTLLLSTQGAEGAPAAGCDADLGSLLESCSVGPQLRCLSFAYSKCLLCIEGSSAFESKLAEQAGKLYAIARQCGLSLQYFYTPSQLATEVSLLHVATECKVAEVERNVTRLSILTAIQPLGSYIAVHDNMTTAVQAPRMPASVMLLSPNIGLLWLPVAPKEHLTQ